MKKLALTAAVAAFVTLGLAGQAHAGMDSVWNWMPQPEAAKADRNDDSLPKARVTTAATTQAIVPPAANVNARTQVSANTSSLAYPDEASVQGRVAVKHAQKQDEKTFNE